MAEFYRAPEVALKQQYDARVDFWAIGCLVVEMIQVKSDERILFKNGGLTQLERIVKRLKLDESDVEFVENETLAKGLIKMSSEESVLDRLEAPDDLKDLVIGLL